MKHTLQTPFTYLLFIAIGLFSCNQQTQAPQNMSELLTAHKWQLTFEKGLNLPSESLADNIIELAPNGELVYYENREKVNLFTKNRWELSKDGKKIIEILPDDSRIESEIVELTNNVLKLTYKESDGLGGTIQVVEQYEKFTPKPVAQLP
jgi:hypothetical protein